MIREDGIYMFVCVCACIYLRIYTPLLILKPPHIPIKTQRRRGCRTSTWRPRGPCNSTTETLSTKGAKKEREATRPSPLSNSGGGGGMAGGKGVGVCQSIQSINRPIKSLPFFWWVGLDWGGGSSSPLPSPPLLLSSSPPYIY